MINEEKEMKAQRENSQDAMRWKFPSYRHRQENQNIRQGNSRNSDKEWPWERDKYQKNDKRS